MDQKERLLDKFGENESLLDKVGDNAANSAVVDDMKSMMNSEQIRKEMEDQIKYLEQQKEVEESWLKKKSVAWLIIVCLTYVIFFFLMGQMVHSDESAIPKTSLVDQYKEATGQTTIDQATVIEQINKNAGKTTTVNGKEVVIPQIKQPTSSN